MPSLWVSPLLPPISTLLCRLRHYKFITGISPQAKKNLTYFLDGCLGSRLPLLSPQSPVQPLRPILRWGGGGQRQNCTPPILRLPILGALLVQKSVPRPSLPTVAQLIFPSHPSSYQFLGVGWGAQWSWWVVVDGGGRVGSSTICPSVHACTCLSLHSQESSIKGAAWRERWAQIGSVLDSRLAFETVCKGSFAFGFYLAMSIVMGVAPSGYSEDCMVLGLIWDLVEQGPPQADPVLTL